MVGRRKYDDGCAVAHALDLVGERWALLVVRELLLGPKRFTDLQSGLPGASPDVLTQRLRELAEAGVLRRRRLAPPAASWVYELTGWKEEHLPEWLEVLCSVVIGEAAARSVRPRQHSKLQTMLIGHINDVDGFIPDTADDLYLPEPERGLCLNPLGAL